MNVLLILDQLKGKVELSIQNFKFREAMSYVMDVARLGNKYLTDTEPWKIFEENPEKALQMQANMYNPHKQPFYQAEGHLTKPVIPRTQVYRELYKAIYRY